MPSGATRWRRRGPCVGSSVGWGAGSREPRPGGRPCRVTHSLSPHVADPRAAPTDVKIRVLNSTAISLQWNRVYSDTVQGQLREYRVREPVPGPPNPPACSRGQAAADAGHAMFGRGPGGAVEPRIIQEDAV